MPGVQQLMVVKHPLASNPEDHQGPGLMQRSADFLSSYGITPEVTAVSTGVGFLMEPGIRGPVKGALIGSLISLVYNNLVSR